MSLRVRNRSELQFSALGDRAGVVGTGIASLNLVTETVGMMVDFGPHLGCPLKFLPDAVRAI